MRTSFLLTASLATVSLGCGDGPPPTPTTLPSRSDHVQAVLAASGGAPALVEKLPAGEIDWTLGHVTVAGTGRAAGASAHDAAMAKRAARLDAGRNVALVLAGLRPGPGGRFTNLAAGRISVEAIVEEFEEISNTFDVQTRTAIAKLRAPLYGVKGVVRIAGPSLTGAASRWTWPASPAEGAANSLLVLDARGTKFRPCVFPRLVTGSGALVHDASDLAEDELAMRGMAIYASALPEDRPGGVVVIRVDGAGGTLKLDAGSESRLAATMGASALLTGGRVLILCDPP
jgi:hypothetical protein